MAKDVPDTKHTQQDNVRSTRAVRLTALTTASDQLWITLGCLTMARCMLPGWSFTTLHRITRLATHKQTHTTDSDVWHELQG